jgi:alanine racemase
MFDIRAVARVSGAALRSNLKAIRARAPGHSVVTMIKADAYGHGAVWAARLLSSQPGVSALGVATFGEAVEVREALPANRTTSIIVFSGAVPWPSGSRGEELGQMCKNFDLTPVIASIEDWRSFHSGFPKKSWSMRIPFELKFNTGMNRLGIGLEDLNEVRADLVELARRGIFPRGVLSHLAVGEDAGHGCSRNQRTRFEHLVSVLSGVLPDSVDFHLANSAASLGARSWKLAGLTRRIRPGLSLYGIPPQGAAKSHGLRPVLTLEAPVILLRELAPGEPVGYGARYRTRRRERVAVLGIGYGEGIHRAWSAPKSPARVLLGGKLQPFLGPISMDMCAVGASARVNRGDWARLWGEGIDPHAQAAAAGTIPYEVLTSLTRRVQRIYV